MSSLLARYLQAPYAAARVQLIYLNIRGSGGWDSAHWHKALQGIEHVDALYIACGTASALTARTPAVVAGFQHPPSIIISLSDYAVEVLGDFMRSNDRSLVLILATDTSAKIGYIRDQLVSNADGTASVPNKKRVIMQGCGPLASATESQEYASKGVEAIVAKCVKNAFAQVTDLATFTHIGVGLACSHYGYAGPAFERQVQATVPNTSVVSLFDIAKRMGRDSSFVDFAADHRKEERAIEPSVDLKVTSPWERRSLHLARSVRKIVISPIMIAFAAAGTMIRVPVPRNTASADWIAQMLASQRLRYAQTEEVATIRKANLRRNTYGLSGVDWLDDQATWSYTMMPCMQGKFRKLAELLRQYLCDGVLEIGGGLNPMDHFVENFPDGYINIEPMAAVQLYEKLNGAKVMHFPTTLGHYWASNASFSTHERALLKPNGYCMVLAGGFLGVGVTNYNGQEATALEQLILGAKVVLLEGGGTHSGFTKLTDKG